MSLVLDEVAWPMARAGEAIEALGRAAHLSLAARALEVPSPPAGLAEGEPLSRWLEATAAWLSLEAEPVDVPYADLDGFVRRAGPALVRLGKGDDARFVALLEGRGRSVTVVDTTRHLRSLPLEAVAAALRQSLESGVAGEIDAMLARTVSPRRRSRARAALLRERLGSRWASGCWVLRSPPGSDLAHLARRAHLPRLLAWMIAGHTAEYALVLLSWWAVAKGALQGRYDSGWLAAWLLLLVSLVPFRLLSGWAASRFAIGAGTLLKTRLLVGALRLEPNEIRHEGAGQLLSRVIESSAVETLGLSGALMSVVALVELAMCTAVLTQGSGGWLHAGLLLVVVAVTVVLGWRYYRRRREWTEVRLSMTHDLVERMVGHRTRIAQEPRARWHDGEDQALERYLVVSRDVDRASVALSLVPRAWLLVGIAALAPGLMTGSPSTVPLAVALGGVLLAFMALQTVTNGLSQSAGAVIGWRQARPLVRAATRAPAAPAPSVATADEAKHAPGYVLLDAQDLRFRYRERGDPVLRGCSLRVAVGDRILLEGPSGGGKSTLGSVLTGLRSPESGLLLLSGLDRHTLGADGWRRRVVAAPQFHENHVFSATFAFNLLMGRGWPPTPRDLEEAEAVCRELELGPLLDRMPAGLQQMVGETGWQLSHGERSRLYIARALLQRAELVVLDESFAALDPETLQRALRCVLDRARTLLVIAHP
jgi:ATP-binding cassette subfamily B protein